MSYEKNKTEAQAYADFKKRFSSISDYHYRSQKLCENIKKKEEKYLKMIPVNEISEITIKMYKWNHLYCLRRFLFPDSSKLMVSLEECRKKSKGFFIGCEDELEIFKNASDDRLNFLISNEDGLYDKIEKAQLSCARISHEARLCDEYLQEFQDRFKLEDDEFQKYKKRCVKLNEEKKNCISSIFCENQREVYEECIKDPSKKCEKLKKEYESCAEINEILIRSTIISKVKDQ
eukprot:gene9266-1353_t